MLSRQMVDTQILSTVSVSSKKSWIDESERSNYYKETEMIKKIK